MAPETAPSTPDGFVARRATLSDVPELTRLWYASFNASHKFWEFATPEDTSTRKWFDQAWTIGIQSPHVLRTWIVEDTAEQKAVAFARWHLPQPDANQDIPLPPYPSEWDAEVTDALWEGMARNRLAVMGATRHLMLEFLGVDASYQGKGLGFSLVDWGRGVADSLGIEMYLDATIMGLPFYKKKFGFAERLPLPIPERPGTFGSYHLVASVRPVPPLPREGGSKGIPESKFGKLKREACAQSSVVLVG